MVMGFKSHMASTLPSDQRHDAWPSEGDLALSTKLPLVNVGTTKSPLYLPTEVCYINDSQRLRGPRDNDLEHHLSVKDREDALVDLPETCNVVEGNLVLHQLPETRAMEQIHKLVEACGRSFPNLLFVEAGSVPADCSSWADLRNKLMTSLQDSFKKFAKSIDHPTSSPLLQQRGDSMPLLQLQYSRKSGPSADWTKKLCELVKAHPGTNQKTVVVVWLEPEKDGNAMYKAIKKACDIDVGVQTVFVKRETLEARTHRALKIRDPVTHAVEDIQRRIRQKNSKMLAATTYEEKLKLIVAMHVTQISSESKPLGTARGQQDCSEMFLVTLVSRDHTLSEQYHTEQGLYKKDDIERAVHVVKLLPFLKLANKLTPGNVTILRSGCMPSKNKHTAQHAKVANEIENLKKVFGMQSQPGAFTYVILTEDSTLATRMDAKVYRVHRPSANLPATLFTKDNLLIKLGERSVKVQQAPRVCSQENDGKAPEVRRGAITATFYRSDEGLQKLNQSAVDTFALLRLNAAKNVSQPMPNGDSKGTLVPMQRYRSTGGRSESSTPNGKSQTHSPQFEIQHEVSGDGTTGSATSKVEVTGADTDLLAALWKDEALGLYSTKWPVPTHLAHLAARRAVVHLRKDDDEKASVPSSLPPVHENVRNTLYYL
jgi:hypothetical protein